MAEHTHEFEPDVAPDYRCECGVIGRRRNGVVVPFDLITATERGVLDTARLWKVLSRDRYRAALQSGNRHVSQQPDDEAL